MRETSKSSKLESRQLLYRKYLYGKCIDVGAGTDPLAVDGLTVLPFDKGIGDAQRLLDHCERGEYDCLYSSHCLEHMEDVCTALAQWRGAIKHGGHMIVVVPEAVFYERLTWPSPFNEEHKAQFSSFYLPKEKIKCPQFYGPNEMEVAAKICGLQIVETGLELEGWDWHLTPYLIDQTHGDAMANLVYVFKRI